MPEPVGGLMKPAGATRVVRRWAPAQRITTPGVVIDDDGPVGEHQRGIRIRRGVRASTAGLGLEFVAQVADEAGLEIERQRRIGDGAGVQLALQIVEYRLAQMLGGQARPAQAQLG